MKYIFALLILCSYVTIQAQDISIKATKSEVFKDKKKHTSLDYSESDGMGGFVTIRTFYGGMARAPKGYYVEHYNQDLKLVNKTEIEIDKSQVKGLMIENGTVYILETLLDKKADLFKFNVLESSLNAFNFQKKTLFTLNEEEVKKYFHSFAGFGIIMMGQMNQKDTDLLGEVTFSANRNFFCVNFDIKDKTQETQRLYVYNKQFEQVFVRDFERDIADKYFQYENIDIDDITGDIYLLGKVFENGSTRRKKKGKANYHYELHKITATDTKKAVFEPGENFIGSLYTVRGENKISCAGFYSERNDSRYKGVCRFDLDPNTLEKISSNYMPFSEEFIIDKYGKKKDKELRNLSYRGGFLTANDELIINAEEYYVTAHTNMLQNGGMTTRYVWHYNDIVSVKISKDGELLWSRNINKQQASGGLSIEYLSFSSTVVGDDTYFFINCADKIKTLSKNRIAFKQATRKKSNLYAIKIDNDGNYTYKSIVDNEDTEVPYFVREGISASEDGKEMIFIGRRKAKKQFLKLQIE